MKISFNKSIQRYIVSEQGVILHTVQDLGDAQRLAGIEPEPLPRFPQLSGSDDLDDDFSDLITELGLQ